ncbi:MAG: hypothetical protein ACI4YB_01895 [Oscillospiraceae bacterium]
MAEKFVSVSAVKKKLNYIFREYAISPLTKKKILGIFDRIPSADVVEVVRCKDCRFHEECFRNIRSGGNKPDDFCSFGERKELDNGKVRQFINSGENHK